MSHAASSWVRHRPSFEADSLNPALATSPWAGHRYFVYDLIAFMRPCVIVELGTHYGCSFFAFLQAIKDLSLDTKCYAIDTWMGDEHSGAYGEDVFNIVEKTANTYFYRQNIHLIKKLFDEAVSDFSDKVDILHIDGYHSYEAVKYDFESWHGKLANDSIVLFHDVAPSTGYGSAEYWQELKQKHPHFEFLHHSWGLGMLFPKGDFWHREIVRAAPEGWQDFYRYQAESELLATQLSATEAMVEERWAAMQDMEAMIGERDKELAARRQEVEALRMIITGFVHRNGLEKSIGSLPAIADGAVPFADLAFSLYLFTSRLNQAAQDQGIRDLFFFSREGLALKEMFDYFQSRIVNSSPIKTHYLEVSRRSTFLPSLGPLDGEEFQVLFRQYRRISLDAFIASLALEDHRGAFADAMGVDVSLLAEVQDDLPTSWPFRRLVETPAFRNLYEQERTARSAALANYVASFTGGSLSKTLHVVDVGWKGSIQDNLFNWFSRLQGQDARIQGYYVGLIAPGNMGERNEKTGLLFSNQSGLTRSFHVFNENRSLFEILLPAQHGSPCSYEATSEGTKVRRDPFLEQELVEARVLPVANQIMDRFRHIVDMLACVSLPETELFSVVVSHHRRIVFSPSSQEIEWMLSVSHVENFGVFAKSHFGADDHHQSFVDRIRFTQNLLIRRRPSEIGFWPYLTLRQRALFGLSAVYRFFRYWQDRSI